MRILLITSALLALTSSVTRAQDVSCTAVFSDFSPTSISAHSAGSSSSLNYQKCYTDQLYNTLLIAQGDIRVPNYKDVLSQLCDTPKSESCSHSTLATATASFLTACNSSINAEAANSGGNVLQIGKIALEIFFAEPIYSIYCSLDPDAVTPTPPAVNSPAYCLANVRSDPQQPLENSKFMTNLALFLTTGSLRATQAPFFESLHPEDTCSPCSQLALNATLGYLRDNLMPKIGPFYTPEFVQYWTKFIPAYNALCKTSFVQKWPKGTLNVTVTMPSSSNTATANLPNTSAAGTDAAGVEDLQHVHPNAKSQSNLRKASDGSKLASMTSGRGVVIAFATVGASIFSGCMSLL